MRDSFTLDQVRKVSLIVVGLGLVIGMTGAVRTGSIILSLGASSKRKISTRFSGIGFGR